MRRSRRNGQLRRTSSIRRRSHSTTSVASLCVGASASICPKGSATNEAPQNSSPLSAGPSKPTRLTAAMKTPFAMACARWTVRQASFCAAQAGQARGFRIPLVPADQHADAAIARVKIGKAEIAGSEVEFFVVERVVRNVHLAIQPEQGTVGVDHCGRVVIDARRAFLEKRSNDHHLELARQLRKSLGRRAGDQLGERKKLGVLFAAKILRPEQFLQANDLGAAPGCLANTPLGLGQVFVGSERTAHLRQTDAEFLGHGCIIPSFFFAEENLPDAASPFLWARLCTINCGPPVLE